LLKGFGLDATELALHNAGNDAVAMLLVGLLVSLNDKLHPEDSHAPVDLIAGRHIADIVISAAQGIKANSKPLGTVWSPATAAILLSTSPTSSQSISR
jgi:hypothetical protein